MSNVFTFEVNGRPVVARAEQKNMSLLRFLRDELRLTGTKCGCSVGDCGACTVIVDGQAVRSCLIKLGRLSGKKVETIEGLSSGGRLHPLQETFLECGAVQCGFCTPGMIMAAKALLDKNLSPTEEDIKQALQHNLCRCTGYRSIIEAVQEAARRLRGEVTACSDRVGGSFIGASFPDKDGVAKVTGTLAYADDLYFDNMLYGALVLSDYPHARLLDVDISDAVRREGVVAVITAKDVPGRNAFGRMKPNQPVIASEKVRYVGDVIAVVFAESQELAREAAKYVRVKYEELPGVYDPITAMEESAPRIHEEGNVLSHKRFQRGDVEEGFRRADVIVEQTYYAPFVEHAYLECEAGVAKLDAEGNLVIYYPTQLPFASRKQVAASLALPEEKVRIAWVPVGGAFGGKTDVLLEILLGLGALKTGRPVKITLRREESIRMSIKRHAFYMRYKTGATSDGKLTALQAKCILDAGAYAGMSSAVAETAVYFGAGPYVWPSLQIEATAVYTNNVPGGAFRGFGVNQVHFAVESQMDIMARKLGLDPIEFRLKNALDIGERTATGEVLRSGVGIKETLRQVKKALEQYAVFPPPPAGKKIGIGIASGYKNVGYGRGYYERAGARITLKETGRLEVAVSVVDMGQGARTVLAQLASGVTGVRYDLIDMITADTAHISDGVAAIGQRQTYLGGNAVVNASKEFLDKLKSFVANTLGERPEDLTVAEDKVVSSASGKFLTLGQVAQEAAGRGMRLEVDHLFILPPTYPLLGDEDPSYRHYYDKFIERERPRDDSHYRNWAAYAYLTQAAVVEVDCSSGEVKLLAIIGAHDVGKAINPQKVKGQIEGSFVMGMGYGLTEEFILDHGRVVTSRLKQLGVPYIGSVPVMVPIIVEEPVPDGPFGAKGASEVAMVPTAAAITNAIFDAVGVRVTSLPATKDKVLGGLRHRVEF